MELDDWELTVEELDSLERDALKQIAQRNSSSSSASTSTSSSATSFYQQRQKCSAPFNPRSQHSPAKPIADSRPNNTVDAMPPASRILPASVEPKVTDDCSKEQPKLSVKFFLHTSGNIAAKFLYDQVLVGAFRKIPKASWNAKERLWMFPVPSLSSAEKLLSELPGSNIEVENLDPLLRRAIIAASSVMDLQVL